MALITIAPVVAQEPVGRVSGAGMVRASGSRHGYSLLSAKFLLFRFRPATFLSCWASSRRAARCTRTSPISPTWIA